MWIHYNISLSNDFMLLVVELAFQHRQFTFTITEQSISYVKSHRKNLHRLGEIQLLLLANPQAINFLGHFRTAGCFVPLRHR